MGDRIGAFVFDKGKADRGMRRPGIFTSDLGDREKVRRMRKRREVQAILDDPARAAKKAGRRKAPAVTAHAPEKICSPVSKSPGETAKRPSDGTLIDALALAKFERAAAKLAHAEDPEPDTSLSMSELLKRARAKAGKL
jgi:hypothetical protein